MTEKEPEVQVASHMDLKDLLNITAGIDHARKQGAFNDLEMAEEQAIITSALIVSQQAVDAQAKMDAEFERMDNNQTSEPENTEEAQSE